MTVQIVSKDAVFAAALGVALRQMGMNAVHLTHLPSSPDAYDEGWVVDLDSLAPSEKLPSAAITFSSSARSDADFVRPFLFRDFCALVSARFGQKPRSESMRSAAPAPDFLELRPSGVLLKGEYIPLSPSEHALLSMLIEHSGECVPTEQLDAIWQENGGNTTAVYIRYLRKKLDEATGLRLIRCIRGKGYCLCLPS